MYRFDRVRSDPRDLMAVDKLLRDSGLRRDRCLDYTCLMWEVGSEGPVATGSCFGETLRCLAVREDRRGEGLLNRLVTHLLNVQMDRGNDHVFLYTRPRNGYLFAPLGFYEIARTDQVLFLENRPSGFAGYCRALGPAASPGTRAAAVVMNANPFTLGHRALVERAARENDVVHLFMVSEDASLIPFSARRRMICEGVSDLGNVVCHDGGAYMISRATFPSYFIKDSPAVNGSHARLDAAVFQKIAQAVGISARYVGEEPASQVTGVYNRVLLESLPGSGVDCVVIPRETTPDGRIISAGAVRTAIRDGDMETLRRMTPESTWRYMLSPEMEPVVRAIRESRDVLHY